MNEALLIKVQKELRIQNRHNSYPFFHSISKISFDNADFNDPVVKRLLEIAQKQEVQNANTSH